MNGSAKELSNPCFGVWTENHSVWSNKQNQVATVSTFASFFCCFFWRWTTFLTCTKELPTPADWYAVTVYLQFRLKHELVQTQTEVFLFPGINPLLPWNWCFLSLPKQQWRLVWINNRNAKEIMETVVELDYFYYNDMLVKCNTGAPHHKQCHSNCGNSWWRVSSIKASCLRCSTHYQFTQNLQDKYG